MDILNEQSRSNPQGLQSLLKVTFDEGGGGQQKKDGGGLGGMLGDDLGG